MAELFLNLILFLEVVKARAIRQEGQINHSRASIMPCRWLCTWETGLGSSVSSKPRPRMWEWAPILSTRVTSRTSATFWAAEAAIFETDRSPKLIRLFRKLRPEFDWSIRRARRKLSTPEWIPLHKPSLEGPWLSWINTSNLCYAKRRLIVEIKYWGSMGLLLKKFQNKHWPWGGCDMKRKLW